MKTLLIREMPEDVVDFINSFKQDHDIKVNTDAVLKIIIDFSVLRESYEELFEKWKVEKDRADKFNEISEHLLQCELAVKIAREGVRQLLEMDMKEGRGQ